MNAEVPHHKATVHRLAREALFSFILTFVAARAVVFLIMSHEIPNMYFFLHGTHVHHLNYGIFLLAAVGEPGGGCDGGALRRGDGADL